MPVMRQDEDADWLGPVDTTAETLPAPASSHPVPPAVWVCSDVDTEPRCYATLLQATGYPPGSPYAIIAGGGELLAHCDDTDAVWHFTPAGARRLADEMASCIARDHAIVVEQLLADDLAAIERAS